ncbi:MAG: hypothetical protein PXX77_04220 [Gallionella sp.]|nr:hypothetical protein [Gallionella sp.]
MRLFIEQQNDDGMTIAQEVVQLADSFAEFHKVNSFMCDAFTSVMSSNDPVKEDVLQGARYCAEYLQSRSGELMMEIKHLKVRLDAAE